MEIRTEISEQINLFASNATIDVQGFEKSVMLGSRKAFYNIVRLERKDTIKVDWDKSGINTVDS